MGVPYKLGTTKDSLTACSGLVILAQLMDRLDLSSRIDQHFPQPGSNRGLQPSVYVRTRMMMMHKGLFRLDDVDRFRRDEEAFLPALGLEQVPDPVTIGKWLRRTGAVAGTRLGRRRRTGAG